MNNSIKLGKEGSSLSASSAIKPPDYILLTRERRKILIEGLSSPHGPKAVLDLIAPPPKEKGYVKRILYLDSSIDDYGNTLLHLAVAFKDHNLVAILLLKGADPNVYNHGGASPLRIARLLRHDHICLMLSKHGARLDFLPIHENEANINNIEITRHSDEDSSRRSSISNPSITPSPNSIRTRSSTIASSSLNRKHSLLSSQDKFTYPKFEGNDIHNAAYVNLSSFVDLLENCTDIDVSDPYYCTSLMKAAYKNHAAIVRALLYDGAHPDLEDSYGYTALIWACFGASEECAKILFQESLKNKNADEILSSYGNGINAPIVTPLMAASYSGSLPLVEFLVSAGSKVNQACGSYDAFRIAFWMGHANIYDYLAQNGANIAKNDTWILKGLCINETGISGLGQKLSYIPFSSSEKLPSGAQLNTKYYNEIQKLKLQQLAKDESKTKASDFGIHDAAKASWAARSSVNKILNGGTPDISKKQITEILNISIPSQYEIPVNELLEYFCTKGTILDILQMNVVRSILQLVQASSNNSKTEYVVIAGKAIQEAGEIVKIIETFIERKPDSKTSLGANLFNLTHYYQQVRDTARSLRNEDVKSMLLATRLAIGAWPPPDAVDNMITSGLRMCRTCKTLAELAGASGIWPLDEISIDLLKNSNNSVTEPNKTSLSFSEYQKQHEAKILDQIHSQSPTNLKPDTQTTTMEQKILSPDDPFFQGIDSLVRQFVQSVQALRQAKNEDRKEDFSNLSSAIYARIDAILEEVNSYYLLADIPDDFMVIEGQPTYRKKMYVYREMLFKYADEGIMKAKLASGVWPPPGASEEMLTAIFPTLALIKDMVTFVRSATVAARKTENEERSKKEKFMNDWVQNERVRNLFNEFEKIQVQTFRYPDQEQSTDYSNLSAEDIKFLEDPSDGIIIDRSSGKPVVKAGRLWRLVEKLADHSSQDFEYRTAFLLTHHSFTTSLDLLDLLMKRYDISPPYGLDQRMFEVYVTKKIVPIRLRIFNVLKTWMTTFTEDFLQNRQLTEKCILFVKNKMANDFGEITIQLLQYLTRYIEGKVPKMTAIEQNASYTKPILPKGIAIEEIASFLGYHPRSFVDIDPVEFARQLTLVDFSIFKEIRAKEFLDQGWEKNDKKTRSPNITRMIKNTNSLTMWVASSIVNCDDLKGRLGLIKYFMNVALACREISNFSALTAFVAAMSMGPVYRMTKTFSAFKDKYNKLSETFSELSEIVSAKGQYAKYRQTLKESKGPIVPFLGVYLTDLTFVDLGNPDYLPETNYINFDKRRKIATTVEDIQQHQMSQYYITEIPAIRDFILKLGENVWPDEMKLYEKSWIVEPREETNDDD